MMVGYVKGIPVYGGISELGYYFVDVVLGTPAQRISAILDTGSEGLSVTCSPCSNCGDSHMDPFYNSRISSTFSRLDQCPASNLRHSGCSFEKRYLEGSSLKGRMFSELITFNGTKLSKTMSFGCIESETKLFREQKANGLMGLAPLPRTTWLFSEERIESFSLCLSTQGGDLDFYTSLAKPSRAVPLLYRNGHYVVSPLSVGINCTGFSWESKGDEYLGKEVLLDSGSTETYLVSGLYEMLVSKIKERTSGFAEMDESGQSLCWKDDVRSIVNPLLPEIIFSFALVSGDGIDRIRFGNYTYFSGSLTCLTVASNAGLNRTDLGASWMIGRKVTLTSSAGWALFESANCTLRSMESRQPVIALPGQLEPASTYSSSLFALIAVFLVLAVFLLNILKRNILFVSRSVIYESIPFPSDQNDHST